MLHGLLHRNQLNDPVDGDFSGFRLTNSHNNVSNADRSEVLLACAPSLGQSILLCYRYCKRL